MTRHSINHAVARALAAVYLLIAAGPGVALVLCVDADGRQGIESGLAPDCCAKRLQGALQGISRGEHSCDCVDMPLVLKTTLATKSQAEPHPPIAHALLLPPLLSAIAPTRYTLGVPILRGPPADVASLRSVILLL
jgi:hypothetical protein